MGAARYSRRAFFLPRHAATTVDEARVGERLTAAILGHCLAQRGIACMSCRDNCPEDAIRFKPRAGGPFLPDVETDTCSGCGECMSSCPADAIALVALADEAAHG